MPPFLLDLFAAASTQPLAQSLVAGIAALICEDPATLGVGLLVAQKQLSWCTAFSGLALGIALGDVGLYLLGRFGLRALLARGWIDRRRLRRTTQGFRRYGLVAVVGSRFIPGMRFPTFVCAGALRMGFGRFVLCAIGASLVWTLLVLTLVIRFGSRIAPGSAYLLLAAALIAVGAWGYRRWQARRAAAGKGCLCAM